jgi:hypothetical protein
MSSWGSYPSIYNLGHKAVTDLLKYPCIVEEKVDGSQFSFGLIEDVDAAGNLSYNLRVRSKGAEMLVDAPEKMFSKGVEHVKSIWNLLRPGWTYRGEYLQKPKHNTLAYDRTPAGHIILFDVSTGDQEWLGPAEKAAEAARLGLECVPVLLHDREGEQLTLEMFRRVLDSQTSVLGGQLVEGVVVKPTVSVYGIDHKTLMGKFVSERFREAHKGAWKESNPTSGDILDNLAKTYTHPGRWTKAVQHLRESGQLQDMPQDIPALIREVRADVLKEEREAIMNALWKWAWPHLERRVTGGLPEWYKEQLLKQQFEESGESPAAHIVQSV